MEAKAESKPLVFAFGDPEPVLGATYLDYLGTFLDISGDYYRPPVDLDGLARLLGANAYHGPILHFKKNQVANYFTPSPLLDTNTLTAIALDYQVFENYYLQKIYNGLGRVVRLQYLPAISMRRGKRADVYYKLNTGMGDITRNATPYRTGEVIHVKGPDVRQGIYGVPEYLGGIQSILLSEDSTLFRRKYFINGAHMGYILVTSDANLDDKTAELIEQQVKNSKGPGNFRSLYLNIPRTTNGQKEPVKLIPVGNIGSKDEFQAIKEITEMEMLAMHRIQPGLAAILPSNVGGFGDLRTQMEVYYEMEIPNLRRPFFMLNELLPGNPVAFREPDWRMKP